MRREIYREKESNVLSIIILVPIEFSSSSSIPELPIHSKFLLIASYLASYNPAKTDPRFFAKVSLT